MDITLESYRRALDDVESYDCEGFTSIPWDRFIEEELRGLDERLNRVVLDDSEDIELVKGMILRRIASLVNVELDRVSALSVADAAVTSQRIGNDSYTAWVNDAGTLDAVTIIGWDDACKNRVEALEQELRAADLQDSAPILWQLQLINYDLRVQPWYEDFNDQWFPVDHPRMVQA
jgi:hypothetical protein